MVHLIDLHHDGLAGSIGAYFVESPEPALVDPGPSTSLPELERGLDRIGAHFGDLRHVLLTHVHLDHAGATGDLVRANSALTVHVHEDGAPHMADPERLVASTRRTFGGDHDRLWGHVTPVPPENIRAWVPGRSSPLPGFRVIPSPGHIAHHLAYEHGASGTLFSGDSMGIILGRDAPTHPPTPPPSLDVPSWENTLERLAGRDVDRVAVTHFGLHAEPARRANQLLERLRAAVFRVRAALEAGDEADADRYEEDVRREQAESVQRERVDGYFDNFKARYDWNGIRFYLERNT